MRLVALVIFALAASASGRGAAQDYGAEPGWRVVNRYGTLTDGAELHARRPDQTARPFPDIAPAVTGWFGRLGPGTPVWVSGCSVGGAGPCSVHAVLPDPESWGPPWLMGFVQWFGEVPASAIRLAETVASTGSHVAGTGVPEGFAPPLARRVWFSVGPTVDAVNVRAGPSTDHRVLFEAVRDERTAIDLLACTDRRPGDRGRWCLAGVDPYYDPLDFNGMMPHLGFVYTAALIPYVFDGGFE